MSPGAVACSFVLHSSFLYLAGQSKRDCPVEGSCRLLMVLLVPLFLAPRGTVYCTAGVACSPHGWLRAVRVDAKFLTESVAVWCWPCSSGTFTRVGGDIYDCFIQRRVPKLRKDERVPSLASLSLEIPFVLSARHLTGLFSPEAYEILVRRLRSSLFPSFGSRSLRATKNNDLSSSWCRQWRGQEVFPHDTLLHLLVLS